MTTSRALLALLVLLVSLPGCGPVTFPMVDRLEPDRQIQVESMWNNMLTPIDRLDRDVLLDTIVSFRLFESGIDRLSMQCEKSFTGGRISIRLSFDRSMPAADALEIDVFDNAGRRVRSEEFSGDEVRGRRERLWSPTDPNPPAQPDDPDAEPIRSEEYKALRRAWEERKERVRSATQPATRVTY